MKKERPNRHEFRASTIAEHQRLFGHLFCRIGGRAFDQMGQEIRLDAHHAGISYAEAPNSKGDENGLLIGSFCHQEILHAGTGAKTMLVKELAKRFLQNKSQETYSIATIDCSKCGLQEVVKQRKRKGF